MRECTAGASPRARAPPSTELGVLGASPEPSEHPEPPRASPEHPQPLDDPWSIPGALEDPQSPRIIPSPWNIPGALGASQVPLEYPRSPWSISSPWRIPRALGASPAPGGFLEPLEHLEPPQSIPGAPLEHPQPLEDPWSPRSQERLSVMQSLPPLQVPFWELWFVPQSCCSCPVQPQVCVEKRFPALPQGSAPCPDTALFPGRCFCPTHFISQGGGSSGKG